MGGAAQSMLRARASRARAPRAVTLVYIRSLPRAPPPLAPGLVGLDPRLAEKVAMLCACLISLGRRSAFGFRTVFAPSRRAISSATSSHAEGNDKFYELRTYSVQPARFGEFLKLTTEHIQMQTARSKLLGYWFTELGGMNEVVHLWEYGESKI